MIKNEINVVATCWQYSIDKLKCI